MELLVQVAIIVVVIVVIATAAYFIINLFGKQNASLTSDQAIQFVLNDFKSRAPNAIVTIINTSPSTLRSGSWKIILTVVRNSTTPCPNFTAQSFDYPATGLLRS